MLRHPREVALCLWRSYCNPTIACFAVQLFMAPEQHYLVQWEIKIGFSRPCLLHPIHCHFNGCVGLIQDKHLASSVSAVGAARCVGAHSS